MKCPLFILNDVRCQSGEETEIGDCIQQACAWWEVAEKRCAVLGIAYTLDDIKVALREIQARLPEEMSL